MAGRQVSILCKLRAAFFTKLFIGLNGGSALGAEFRRGGYRERRSAFGAKFGSGGVLGTAFGAKFNSGGRYNVGGGRSRSREGA